MTHYGYENYEEMIKELSENLLQREIALYRRLYFATQDKDQKSKYKARLEILMAEAENRDRSKR